MKNDGQAAADRCLPAHHFMHLQKQNHPQPMNADPKYPTSGGLVKDDLTPAVFLISFYAFVF
jgi:hypothetical protein